MISEMATLRKEIHTLHSQLDSANDTIRNNSAELEKSHLETATARAEIAVLEEKYSKMSAKNKQLEDTIKQQQQQHNCSQECIVLREENVQLKQQLQQKTRQHHRVDNAHTPPSAGSDSQNKLKNYRREHAERCYLEYGIVMEAITNSNNYVLENEIAHETNDKAVRKGVSLILYGLEDKTKGKKWNEDEEEKTTIYNMDVTEEIDCTVDKCPECGADVDVKHECKMVIDTPVIVKATKKQIKSSKGKCKNNHKINTMPKGYTKGSMFGPNLMTMIVFMFFTTLSLNSISHMLTLVGVPKVSKVTIMNALTAVAREKFAATAKQISKNLAKTRYLMGDETPVKIGIKRGYAWVFIGEYGISFVITRSRGAAVLDIHCPLFDIPIVVDGYAAYNKFKTKQRCWAHVLRDAELLAAMQGGNLVELHQKLQHIFHEAKQLPPDTTDQQLQDNWIDPVMAIAGTYTELGYSFGGKLLNAAPDLFTFVKYPGMPPTNNKSERTLRRVVIHKKIRQMFRSTTGMEVYGILMSCMMTWYDQDKDLVKNIHNTIMAS